MMTNLLYLAKQISDEFESFVNGLAVVAIYNAKKKSDAQETAVSNGCDILIATPDRLREFIDESKVDLSQVKHVVLDEMDDMLETNVIDDVKKILKNIFTSGNRKIHLNMCHCSFVFTFN
jgi:superfamily II DNA/RNA helicase